MEEFNPKLIYIKDCKNTKIDFFSYLPWNLDSDHAWKIIPYHPPIKFTNPITNHHLLNLQHIAEYKDKNQELLECMEG